MRARSPLPWVLATAAWLACIGVGFAGVWRYGAARGADTRAPGVWPAGTTLPRAHDRATLLVFMHPRCVCSHATVTELARLLPRVRGRVAATAVFVRPRGVPDGWTETELRRRAAGVVGLRVVDDDGGVEARRFGAATSGATLLFAADGRLLFSGGLTDSRGHEGDSFGEERVVALLTSGAADRNDSPVFGCPLEDGHAAKEPTQ
jgi:hypothetical protein